MAQLKQFGISGVGNGILHPAKNYHFRVEFKSGILNDEARKLMTLQLINFKMNFVDKTFTFEIEQPIAYTELIEVVNDYVQLPCTTILHIMDGNDQSCGQVLFSHLECLEHNLDFDYAGNGKAVRHFLKMKFNTLTSTK